jgi:hypothetical protein
VRLLEELDDPALLSQVQSQLHTRYGQASTVAAAPQNTFNYVFRLYGYPDSPTPPLLVSISDWQQKLRLSSDYGWGLNAERKPVRTEKFGRRSHFTQQLKAYLQEHLQVSFRG